MKAVAEQNKLGRPSIFNKVWNEENKQKALALYAIGASDSEIICFLNKTHDLNGSTFYRWLKVTEEEEKAEDKSDFCNTIKKGRQLSKGWWEGQGRNNLHNKDFNAGLWFMNMKNRFREDWKDRHEVEHTGNTGITVILKREEVPLIEKEKDMKVINDIKDE